MTIDWGCLIKRMEPGEVPAVTAQLARNLQRCARGAPISLQSKESLLACGLVEPTTCGIEPTMKGRRLLQFLSEPDPDATVER